VQIAILLYDRFTLLDAVGPYEVLARLPDVRVQFVATQAGAVRVDTGLTALQAETDFDAAPRPDVVIVPGGAGTVAAMQDQRTVEWVRAAHQHTRFTTSVCTGAFLLGAAGLLEGLQATTHWASREYLPQVGATYVPERVVHQGKIITAAGVSAGIDMALALAAELAGEGWAQASQLVLEYDPQPPFDSGTLPKATPEVVAMGTRLLRI
jgi:transcriptional regulator GlxA family with amidase domain